MSTLPWRQAFPLVLFLLAGATPAAADQSLDDFRLDQVRIEGSHNSYRPLPSPVAQERIKTALPKLWPALQYGHPPLESQLALGLRQLEIDVAPDPQGGLYAAPYAAAAPEVKALMAAPGAKVLHIAGIDTEVHCLTFRTCLGTLAHWSDHHPGHEPVVILVNSVDPEIIPGVWSVPAKFDQASIDALDRDIAEVIGRDRVVAPDDVRGSHASLRGAVLARAWPKIGAIRGKFLFVLDGSDAHLSFLRAGHPSLRGRLLFGWFGEDEDEAAFFNLQDPLADYSRIRALVEKGFIVRTRADADLVEARAHDGRRMKAALTSGAQVISTDFYRGAPDPENLGYESDFRGAPMQCNEVLGRCDGEPR